MSEAPPTGMEHDAALAALYRAAGSDEPPTALDDAIRAAARRSVFSRPQRPGAVYTRWRVPASVAAVLVLSASLVALMREEAPHVVELPTPEMAPAPAQDPSVEATIAARESLPTAQDALGRDASGAARRAEMPQSAPVRRADPRASAGQLNKEQVLAARPEQPLSPAAPEPFPDRGERSGGPAVGAAAKPERYATEDQSRMRESKAVELPQSELPTARPQAVPPRPAESPASAPAAAGEPRATSPGAQSAARAADNASREPSLPRARAAAKSAPAVELDYTQLPDKWLEQIDTLRRQGRQEEAKRSLAEFRKRYPDYPLPAALQEWAR